LEAEAMSRYEDVDGIDGPFNRAMNRAMEEDAEIKPPYVVMKCVNCARTYKIGPGGEAVCPKDYGPMYAVKAVGR
jgi:hypothetical protein